MRRYKARELHTGLPGALRHSVLGYDVWGDTRPESYIQAYLGHCVTPSLATTYEEIQGQRVAYRPTWGIASLRPWLRRMRRYKARELHTGLPGALRHSANLRTSTPGYMADRACREYMLFQPRWHDDVAYKMYNVVCIDLWHGSDVLPRPVAAVA
jgi:hypothetical protein